ncbi:sensor histidine kinase [Listeria ilorinensis]|uniref:sensor histidine kinase n=1 Tax=Listeria ilorinensis TaxID=2867439 RepID=UPI001EF66777|nr:histidine kinase [Listeria ilorinensis]
MKSLQKRILLYITGSLVLLFTILLLLMHHQFKTTVIPLNESLTQQIVQAKSDQISSWFSERRHEIETIASIAGEHAWSREEILRETTLLEQRMKGEYESIHVVDANGESYANSGQHFAITNRNYYRELEESTKTYAISDLLYSRKNDAEIVVLLYRIEPLANDEAVYIAAAVNIEKMRKLAGEIEMYDSRGKLFTAPASSLQPADNVNFSSEIEGLSGWRVEFGVPRSDLEQGMIRMQQTAMLTALLIILVLILLFSLFKASIVKPIRQLKTVMQQTSTGDRSIRAVVDRQDEIGELAENFNTMLDNLYEIEKEQKTLQFRMIQEQVKPHFLYNTLDTIRWLASGYDAHEVVTMLEDLSLYFRLGLGDGQTFIHVEQEFRHATSYLNLQQVRYEDILRYETELSDAASQQKMPRFILQPLVENAIYHGIKPLGDKIYTIILRGYLANDQLVLEIENNGQRISPEKQSLLENMLNGEEKPAEIGFGFYSVYRRLKLIYGSHAQLEIHSTEEKTLIRICLAEEGRAADASGTHY